MNKFKLLRLAFDGAIGVICGVIEFFSIPIYLALCGVCVIVLLLLMLRGTNIKSYGQDETGEFSVGMVATRILAVNLGLLFALGVLEIIFHSSSLS